MAESGIEVKRLREYIIGDEVKKVITLQKNIRAESGIQMKGFLWTIDGMGT